MTDDDNLIDKEGNVDEDELDRRVRELGLDQTPSIEHAREEAAKIDDEFGDKLKKLEDRARAQKLIRDNKVQEQDRKLESDKETARGLGVGLSIAYALLSCPVLGLIIGHMVDQSAHTTNAKGIGVAIGSIVGIAMTFVLLARTNAKK